MSLPSGGGTTNLTTGRKTTTENITPTCGTIKLGIDADAKWYCVARQVDGATPQPVQKMELDGPLTTRFFPLQPQPQTS